MTFILDFTDIPNGAVPRNQNIEFLELIQDIVPLYNREPAPDTYFDVDSGLLRFKFGVTGSSPTIVHGQRISIVSRISEQDVDGSLFFNNPIPFKNKAGDGFIAEFFVGLMAQDDEPGTPVYGAGVRAEWNPTDGWVDACKCYAGHLGTGTPVITASIEPDTDNDSAIQLDFWKDKNAITITKVGTLLTANFNGTLQVTWTLPKDATYWRLSFHVAAYNIVADVAVPYQVVYGFSGTDLGPQRNTRPDLFPSFYHNYPVQSVGYHQIPLHDLRRKGKIRQEGPRTFVALEDLDFTSTHDAGRFVANKGDRFASAEFMRDFSQEWHSVRLIIPEH